MTIPQCTIAIPVYNREILVRKAVESALMQEAAGLEVLVIDNCSTDGTWDALNSYRDPRLRLLRNDTNIGLFGNLNRCLEEARGDYVTILCSDDRLTPDCIGPEVAFMNAHPDVALLSTRGWFVNEAGERHPGLGDDLTPGIYERDAAIRAALWVLACYGHNAFNYPSGVLLRRQAALAAGRFDDKWHLVSDVDYWLRMAGQGRVAFTDTVGCEVLLHADQLSGAALQSGRYIKEWFDLLERWRPDLGPASLYAELEAQMAAYSLWFARSFRRKGQTDMARVYTDDALARGISRPRLLNAVTRMIAYKAQARILGRRVQPGVAFEPIRAQSLPPTPAAQGARL